MFEKWKVNFCFVFFLKKKIIKKKVIEKIEVGVRRYGEKAKRLAWNGKNATEIRKVNKTEWIGRYWKEAFRIVERNREIKEKKSRVIKNEKKIFIKKKKIKKAIKIHKRKNDKKKQNKMKTKMMMMMIISKMILIN